MKSVKYRVKYFTQLFLQFVVKLRFIFLKKDPAYLDLFQINTMRSASAKLLYCKRHLGFFCIEIPIFLYRIV